MSERNEEVVPLRSTPQVQDAERKAVMPNLLPCPFCGDARAFVHENDWCEPSEWDVGCHACGSSTGGCTTREMAIAAWNSRSPSPDAVREALEKATNAIGLMAAKVLPRNQLLATGLFALQDELRAALATKE